MRKKKRSISQKYKEELTPPLPNDEVVNQALEELINPKEEKQPTKKGRPSLKKGRVKFTTMIKPALRDKLKHLAIEENKSLADMIEEMIEHYIKKHEK